MSNEETYIWRVSRLRNDDGTDGVSLEFGPEMSDVPVSDDVKVQMLGKALIGLGTKLMTSSVNDDGDEWYEEED